MREMGPLTCVMACVVWSASQSTVPVVCTATDHVVLPTTAVLRWLNWSAVRVNIPGFTASAASDLLSGFWSFWSMWQAESETPSRPRKAGASVHLRKREDGTRMAKLLLISTAMDPPAPQGAGERASTGSARPRVARGRGWRQVGRRGPYH